MLKVTNLVMIAGECGFVRLSTRGRYAVMAMADLAMYGGDGPRALSDIVRRHVISVSYLEQLFAQLRRSGLVKSVRGPGGGYMLARPPEETPIADIMMAVNQVPGGPAPASASRRREEGGDCVTEDLWEEVDNRIFVFLNAVTLADVCERRVLGLSGTMHQERANAPASRFSGPQAGLDDHIKGAPRRRARR